MYIYGFVRLETVINSIPNLYIDELALLDYVDVAEGFVTGTSVDYSMSLIIIIIP